MKQILQLVAWSTISLLIVYAAFNPVNGVAYQGPMAAIGIGMIGAGLCIEGRKRMSRPTPQTAQTHTH